MASATRVEDCEGRGGTWRSDTVTHIAWRPSGSIAAVLGFEFAFPGALLGFRCLGLYWVVPDASAAVVDGGFSVVASFGSPAGQAVMLRNAV